jgi:hypothetical protein
MIAGDLETAVERLGGLIGDARHIVPFTGAGISTESGIPDFRSPGGLWTKNKPIGFDDYIASQMHVTKPGVAVLPLKILLPGRNRAGGISHLRACTAPARFRPW